MSLRRGNADERLISVCHVLRSRDTGRVREELGRLPPADFGAEWERRYGDRSASGGGMNNVPPPDEVAHLDGRLIHDLSEINYRLAQYMVRFYDADAGRVEPISITDEIALAEQIAAAAEAVRARAARRWSESGGSLSLDGHVDGEQV